MATLLTGTGAPYITAQQDADYLQGMLGGEFDKVLPVGNKMAYSIVSNSLIRILDGVLIDQEGRRIQIDPDYFDSFTIPTGTSSGTQYYIIGYHIYIESDLEYIETFVEQVSSSTDTIEEASIRNGATEKYVSLYRVTQTGLAITAIGKLFTEALSLTDITDQIEEYLPFPLATDGTTYGYIKSGETEITPFRDPQGDATAAQVLAGYTFSNAASDGLAGTMVNRGAVTLSPSGAETVSSGAGYYSSLTIDGTAAYAAGEADLVNWETGSTFKITGSDLSGGSTISRTASQAGLSELMYFVAPAQKYRRQNIYISDNTLYINNPTSSGETYNVSTYGRA